MLDEVTTIEELTEITNARINRRIHPYLEKYAGWRLWPWPLSNLHDWEPAHIISLSDADYCVDGLPINTSLTIDQKIKSVHKVIKIFCPKVTQIARGKTLLGHVATFNAVFQYRETPEKNINALLIDFDELVDNHWKPTGRKRKHLIIAFHRDFHRFAFKAEKRKMQLVESYLPDPNREIELLMVENNEPRADEIAITVSPTFFKEPKAENAQSIGDLILLSQAVKHWVVSKPISPRIKPKQKLPPLFFEVFLSRLAGLLHKTIGFESFERHAGIEFLMGDRKQQWLWRRLIREEPVFLNK